MHPSNSDRLPLDGMLVVEFGHSVAGPFAGQILSDLGADVVKIEKPEGDDARRWGPPFLDGTGATFQALNRNKRSVVANLRDAGQRQKLADYIVDHADVVLQNLRPGQADQVGLGAAALLARKPGLVYCNMGAFGARGPLATRPGYDPLMQAFGGIMSVVGETGRPAVRVGPSIIDCGTAMWAALGIVSALLRRRDTGVGGVVDVSLFETAASWMNIHAAQFAGSKELPARHGSGQVGIVPYRAYQTADIELVVAAGNDGLFRKMSAALGHPEWASDARFASNPLRVRHSTELYALIEPVMLTRTAAQWTLALDAVGVPCAPVQDVQQMVTHPQTEALGILQAVPGCSAPLIGLPISFDGRRPQPRSAAPTLGADTAHVFDPSADAGASSAPPTEELAT
jgi:crotonobetainyl-CoA:carnitine CoA-transferase CaiB-like acyl-CoA transferase